jgi:predicted nucleic acid-binding Zn ribbon protein
MFEFLCMNSHRIEALVDPDTPHLICSKCGQEAAKVISAPTVSLEGVSGSYPTAYDAWNRKRSEKLAQERKQADS